MTWHPLIPGRAAACLRGCGGPLPVVDDYRSGQCAPATCATLRVGGGGSRHYGFVGCSVNTGGQGHLTGGYHSPAGRSSALDRKPVRSLRRRRGYALCGSVGPFPAAADTVSAGVDDDLPAVLDGVVGREPGAADQPFVVAGVLIGALMPACEAGSRRPAPGRPLGAAGPVPAAGFRRPTGRAQPSSTCQHCPHDWHKHANERRHRAPRRPSALPTHADMRPRDAVCVMRRPSAGGAICGVSFRAVPPSALRSPASRRMPSGRRACAGALPIAAPPGASPRRCGSPRASAAVSVRAC